MGIFRWAKEKISSFKGFERSEKKPKKVKAKPDTFERHSKGFKGNSRKYEIQDTKDFTSVLQGMETLLHNRDEDLRKAREKIEELHQENKDLLKEVTVLKTSKVSKGKGQEEPVTSSNPAIRKLLKALRDKPMDYDEIKELLGLQTKSGAYSYVSTAIAQEHPIGKIKEGRRRKIIRTDVTYKTQGKSEG